MVKEKDITPRVLQYMRDNASIGSCLVEIKMVHGKTLPARALKEHQRRALDVAHNASMYFKIPDVGYQNPADAFILKKAGAYLVIFYAMREGNECWAIPICFVPETSIGIDYARKFIKIDTTKAAR